MSDVIKPINRILLNSHENNRQNGTMSRTIFKNKPHCSGVRKAKPKEDLPIFDVGIQSPKTNWWKKNNHRYRVNKKIPTILFP